MKNLLRLFTTLIISGAGTKVNGDVQCKHVERPAAETGVYIGGGVIGGHNAHQLTDDDGDGIMLPSNLITVLLEELHFPNLIVNWVAGTVGGHPVQSSTGMIAFAGIDWRHRAICFGICSEDGSCELAIETADITFSVNTQTIEVGANGMYLGGGDYFGDAMGHAMSDADGDGTYEVVVAVPVGYSGNYVFLNSPNDGGDWNAKEDLAGLPCADGTWNDRLLPTVTGEASYSTCFGQCSTDGSCEAPDPTSDVTFSVDMVIIQILAQIVMVVLTAGVAVIRWLLMVISSMKCTLLKTEDTVEYKFTLDGWTNQRICRRRRLHQQLMDLPIEP